jgi:hypothetical protein
MISNNEQQLYSLCREHLSDFGLADSDYCQAAKIMQIA